MDEVTHKAAAETDITGSAAETAATETTAIPELHVINTLEALKVFSDPLRQQIMESLLETAKTVKQVAAELNLAPTKLYYHINLLEEHGLIRVSETRVVSGIIEKHYTSAAHHFRINRALLSPGQEDSASVDAVFDAVVEPVRDDLRRSMAAGIITTYDDIDQPDAPQSHALRMWRTLAHMSVEQAEAFYARLATLLEEFEDMEQDESENAQAYTLVALVFPTVTTRGHKPKRRKPSG